MRKLIQVLVVVLLITMFRGRAWSQAQPPETESEVGEVSRPYVWGGLDLSGNGYQPAAPIFGAGYGLDHAKFIAHVEGSFDNAHKVNDATGQDSGYTVRGRVDLFGRLPSQHWFVGGGASYTDLHTDLYSKHAFHPRVGGGKDNFATTWSSRLQAEYIFRGTDKLNSTQGPEVEFWIPSPAITSAHWFFRERLASLVFHNVGQTSHSVETELQLTILYRF